MADAAVPKWVEIREEGYDVERQVPSLSPRANVVITAVYETHYDPTHR